MKVSKRIESKTKSACEDSNSVMLKNEEALLTNSLACTQMEFYLYEAGRTLSRHSQFATLTEPEKIWYSYGEIGWFIQGIYAMNDLLFGLQSCLLKKNDEKSVKALNWYFG